MSTKTAEQSAEILTGSEIIVRSLAEEGVEVVFGYPGGSVLNIYDAIYKQDKFQHVLVRHEQGAVHMADAYARSSNKVGVALVTSGPGATNAVTGIATAFADSIPMVIFTGQVHTWAIGQDAFQEVDTVGITRPCVKHNFLVKDVKDLAMTIKKAFYIAKTGRPGPVVIDVPKDVTANKCEFVYPKVIEMRSYKPVLKGHLGQIRKALNYLIEAERPLIHIGGGVISANASELLQRFSAELGIPVNSTLMGLGAMKANDKKFLGMVGMHGTYEANMAMQNCDVLLAIGARFDDRVIGAPKNFALTAHKIIHVDVDPTSIAKRVEVDVPIVGDVKVVLADMLNQLEQIDKRPDPEKLASWQNKINEWREVDCLGYENSKDIIKPQFVLQKLWEIAGEDLIVASDVGQHQMWCAQYLGFSKPRRWLTSGGLGTMGVGLPYGIGACKANPGSPVAVVTGDGSIQMNIQELATAKQEGLAPKIILLNNNYLGMVRQWQELEYSKRYSQSHMAVTPDFKALAEAYGHVGIVVDKPEDVEGALRDAFGKYKDQLVFIDFHVDSTENVWPMVKAGRGLTEMILGSEKI
jgi:acetolactate synthase-1/2/3 large subunit